MDLLWPHQMISLVLFSQYLCYSWISQWHWSLMLQIYIPIFVSVMNAIKFSNAIFHLTEIRHFQQDKYTRWKTADRWKKFPKCQVVPHSQSLCFFLQLHQVAGEEIRGGGGRRERPTVLLCGRESRHALLRRVPWLRLWLPLRRVVLRGLQGFFQEEHPRYQHCSCLLTIYSLSFLIKKNSEQYVFPFL